MENLESFEQLFGAVKERCERQLSDTAFSLWIKDIEPLRFEDSIAFLKVTSAFKKDILEKRYLSMLEKAFESVMGFDVGISFVISLPRAGEADGEKQPPPDNLESDYTFETFIVGNSNKFAHAASQAVAANPARAYNPLFIYGPSGLGKTHLLYAVSTEITKNFANQNIVYVKGDQFTNELIDAIKYNTTDIFHDKYRSADVLLMDDVQFIGGKESTQEEFFHTFNTLFQANKQIILTSDRPPKEIKTLEDRLRTRFEWGLLADIQPPDFETRTAIIKRKAEYIDFEVSTEIAEYIANRLKDNIRQLEGTVKKLKATSQIENSPPSIMMAQEAIRDILTDNQPIPVTVDRIITEVARTFNVMPVDLRSNKRSSAISQARQAAMYVVREITQLSQAAIGEEFGGRDHSTVVYALQKVEDSLETKPLFREMIEDIIKNIRGH